MDAAKGGGRNLRPYSGDKNMKNMKSKREARLTPIYRAMHSLSKECPYFSRALMNIRVEENCKIETIGVDEHWRMHVNTQWTGNLRDDELVGVVYHELLHLVCDHASRRKRISAQADLWNISADAEINSFLSKEGYSLPSGGVFPSTLGLPEGLLAEQYYQLLCERNGGGQHAESASEPTAEVGACRDPLDGRDQAERSELSGEPQSRSGAGMSSETEANPAPKHGGKGSSGTLGSDGLPQPSWGRGSGSDGLKKEWETSSTTGVDDALKEEIVEECASSIAGTDVVPEFLRRWAHNVKRRVKKDWRTILRQYVSAAIAIGEKNSDYSYRRPSRRRYEGVIMPGRISEAPEVCVIMDVSGSMDSEALGDACQVCLDISDVIGGQVIVALADVAVHDIFVAQSRRDIERRLVGGGGTDMASAIEEVVRSRAYSNLSVIVVVTDGETPWPSSAPRVPVVVCLVGDYNDSAPPWARTVKCEK